MSASSRSSAFNAQIVEWTGLIISYADELMQDSCKRKLCTTVAYALQDDCMRLMGVGDALALNLQYMTLRIQFSHHKNG